MNFHKGTVIPLIPTVEQTRACERHTMQKEGISSLSLMERAGIACVEHLLPILHNHPVSGIYIFCGTGNNGGDGLVIARHLSQTTSLNIEVVVCQGEQAHRSAEMAENLQRWTAITATNPSARLSYFDTQQPVKIPSDAVVIDAIFGIGLQRNVSGVHAAAIRTINASDAFTIAIDTPSGLFCDQPTPHGNNIIIANVTLSIQYPKLAHLTAEAYPFYGSVQLVDIQMYPPDELIGQRALILPSMVRTLLHEINPHAHKGSFGHGLLIAGSDDMPGAAILSATAALRGGIGKLTVHTTGLAGATLPMHLPEAILHRDANDQHISGIRWDTLPASINAIAIGPGLGTHPQTTQLIKNVLDEVCAPLILDADALNMLANNKTWLAFLPALSILTPHIKEFDRLAGPSQNEFERMEKARIFAQKHSIILILKGHHTIITMPDGRQFFNTTGNPGMATAGSGDVLTGLLLSLLSQGYTPTETALIGVYLHGLAGDLCCATMSPRSLIASDICNHIGQAFHILETDKTQA